MHWKLRIEMKRRINNLLRKNMRKFQQLRRVSNPIQKQDQIYFINMNSLSLVKTKKCMFQIKICKFKMRNFYKRPILDLFQGSMKLTRLHLNMNKNLILEQKETQIPLKYSSRNLKIKSNTESNKKSREKIQIKVSFRIKQ